MSSTIKPLATHEEIKRELVENERLMMLKHTLKIN